MGYPLRGLLFRLDPERSHELALTGLRALALLPSLAERLAGRWRVDDPRLAQTLFGQRFANPVGLAAGFDKDGVAVAALPALGFGFAEVGTVTPRPQEGNPRPRLFRHPGAESLQNALGFNNAGMAALAARLAAQRPYPLPVGVNLGKGRGTPPGEALADYRKLVQRLAPLADYLVVNLSSPNTPGLRDLQNEGFVREVLGMAGGLTDKPVLVKLSPDLGEEPAAALAAAALEAGAAGIVATNTTTDYALLPGAREGGGLSGRVLREKSFRMLRALAPAVSGRGVLVSVGGIDSGAEAYRRLRAGASLVQLYTALVYRGPGLVRRINEELLALLERDGVGTVAEVIGADLPS
ncbi:MAG TPA: quinone-dependent dihydroorotate dehydrogenase [Thermoanaerobaculia bacterium]|nr:quinone-dependent dihydroorotate dehydrogenase [Thermoanaerobaculia bacterium]